MLSKGFPELTQGFPEPRSASRAPWSHPEEAQVLSSTAPAHKINPKPPGTLLRIARIPWISRTPQKWRRTQTPPSTCAGVQDDGGLHNSLK